MLIIFHGLQEKNVWGNNVSPAASPSLNLYMEPPFFELIDVTDKRYFSVSRQMTWSKITPFY